MATNETVEKLFSGDKVMLPIDEAETGICEGLFSLSRSFPEMDTILESLLFCKTRVAFAESHIGEQGIQNLRLAQCQVDMGLRRDCNTMVLIVS